MATELVSMSRKEIHRLDVIRRVMERRLTQVKAAQLLGLSPRQVGRLCAAYERHGPAGLVSQQRGKVSNHRLPEALRVRALELVRERYGDFGPTLAREKLRELHGVDVARETLRKWMAGAGIWLTRDKRRARAHQPRHRRGRLGELGRSILGDVELGPGVVSGQRGPAQRVPPKTTKAARICRMRKINRPDVFVAILLLGLACQKGGGSNSSDGGSTTSGTGGSTGGGGSTPAGSGGMAGGTSGSNPGGTGGGAGIVGGPGGGTGGAVMAPEGNSVLQRNHHATRDGHYVQPTMTKAAAAKIAMDPGFNPTFGGRFYASPLYVEDGPMHKGVFIVGSANNDVIAFDEMTGAIVWTKNIGPPGSFSAGCENVNPRGIVGTPIIDLKNRIIYAAGAVDAGHYEVHALSIDDGSEKAGWPAIIDGRITSTEGGLAFNLNPENQRGALALVNGILYVPFGGHDGDCGNYHGWVVAIDTKNPAMVAGWATMGPGGGIWASGGMASDGNGVFATTGNGYGTMGVNLDSEAVIRIRGMASLTRGNADIFYPAEWKAIDDRDNDMGGTSPVVFDLPGSTPMKLVASAAQHGHVYFMDTAMMGGMGGQVAEHVATTATASHSLTTALTSYKTAMGTYVALAVDGNSSCTGGRALMSIKVDPGPPITTTTAWCLPIDGSAGIETDGGSSTAAPMITTTDGMSEPIVWIMSGTNLVGFDGDTGTMVAMAGTCGPPHQWTAPIAVKGRIIVGVAGRLCSWSVH